MVNSQNVQTSDVETPVITHKKVTLELIANQMIELEKKIRETSNYMRNAVESITSRSDLIAEAFKLNGKSLKILHQTFNGDLSKISFDEVFKYFDTAERAFAEFEEAKNSCNCGSFLKDKVQHCLIG